MPTSSKPRKTRRTKRPPFITIWDKINAATDRPIGIDHRIRISIATLNAMEKAKEGTATLSDWQAIADCVNLTETIVLFMKLADDKTGVIKEATQALIDVQRAIKENRPAVLQGQGLVAVDTMVSSYRDLLSSLTERQYVECEAIAAKRYELIAKMPKNKRMGFL